MYFLIKAGSPLGGKKLRRKNFRQSNWLIELTPRKNVEPRIVGIRSTFRGSTFFRLVELLHDKEYGGIFGSKSFYSFWIIIL